MQCTRNNFNISLKYDLRMKITVILSLEFDGDLEISNSIKKKMICTKISDHTEKSGTVNNLGPLHQSKQGLVEFKKKKRLQYSPMFASS